METHYTQHSESKPSAEEMARRLARFFDPSKAEETPDGGLHFKSTVPAIIHSIEPRQRQENGIEIPLFD